MEMPDTMEERVILAGDVGGTKTNLGLFVEGKQRPRLKVLETFPSAESSDLESIVERFVERRPAPVAIACFGIAGPVLSGRCKATNLPWEVSEGSLKKRFKFPQVRLINDLAATARAVPLLRRDEQFPLNSAKMVKGQTLALAAPGTGLGEALLVFHEGRFIPIPSEGGHVDFSPTSEAEVMLWRYMRERWDHVSVERILSGPGLAHIYAWTRERSGTGEPAWLRKRLEEEDPAKVITEIALDQADPLCMEALDTFVSILGAQAGNLALVGMALGGLFLGGGIPPKILPALKGKTFMKSFTAKGRFKNFMERIPVRVILNDKAALMGAAQAGVDMLKQGGKQEAVGSRQ